MGLLLWKDIPEAVRSRWSPEDVQQGCPAAVALYPDTSRQLQRYQPCRGYTPEPGVLCFAHDPASKSRERAQQGRRRAKVLAGRQAGHCNWVGEDVVYG
jgi:hypothetical protein